jgi:hypothetical protein
MNVSTKWLAASVAAILLSGVLIAARIASNPPITDEVFLAVPAWNLAHHGFPGTTVLVDTNTAWQGVNRRTYNTLPGGIVYLASWFAIFPATILSSRIAMTLWGPILLAGCFMFLRRVTADLQVATFGTILLVLNYNFIVGVAQVRVDVMTASLGMAALASYCEIRLRSLKAAVLVSSTLTVLACLTHPQGVQYVAGLLIVALVLDRKSLSPVHFALAAVPFAICGALWLWYVSQDPAAAFSQLRANSRGRLPRSWNPLYSVRREVLKRYLTGEKSSQNWIWKLPLLLIPLLGIAGTLLTRSLRRQSGLRLILLLTAAILISQTFFENYKFHYYLIHIEIFYCALMAALALHTWRAGAWQRAAAALVFAAYLLIGLSGVASKLRADFTGNGFSHALAFLQSNVSSRNLVIGNMSFWFDCCGPSHKLVDDPNLGVGHGLFPDYYVDQGYEADWNKCSKENPNLFAAIQVRRAGFDLIYDRQGYRIYRRR